MIEMLAEGEAVVNLAYQGIPGILGFSLNILKVSNLSV